MGKPLRVLMVEDSEDDALLVLRELNSAGYDVQTERVEEATSLRNALSNRQWDIILTDHSLPRFSSLQALDILLETGIDLPFIIVSGSINEEIAVAAMKSGAGDYVMKNNLARLVPVVERELREAESRRARRQAEQSREMLAAIIEATTDFVATAGLDGLIIHINGAGKRMLGLSETQELSGLRLDECYPEWARHLVMSEGIREALEKGAWSGETALLSRNGAEIPVSQVILVHRDNSGGVDYLSTIARNITERKWAEEALRESEQRYRELFENANDMIFTLDLLGCFNSINKAGERITGYSRAQIYQISFTDLVDADSVAPAVRLTDGRLLESGPQTRKIKIIAKSEQRVVLEVSSRLIYRDGRPIGIQGIGRDITEREHLETQLRQSQKMEAIGRLAGGVAHDFNNLLTAIIGYGQLILFRSQENEVFRTEIEEIIRAGQRAATLTHQLLAFSRRQVLKPVPMDLNNVVSEMNKMLQRLIGENIELTSNLHPDLGLIMADSGQIEQVILNLALNARDAMPGGGRLAIRTANVELGESGISTYGNAAPGPYTMLSVTDSGCGMDAETQAHMFEPFFTTKGEGKGTGLGLATVYGIINQSGGYIEVHSNAGAGTAVFIYLPHVAAEPEAAPERPRFESLPRGNETILLVEDEPIVRDLAAIVLRNQGYTVLEAPDGEEALKISDRYKDETIHLLLTDIVMPRVSGKELAQVITGSRPETKVLFASGYADESLLRNSPSGADDVAFIQKPFTPGTLARKVREVLDQ